MVSSCRQRAGLARPLMWSGSFWDAQMNLPNGHYRTAAGSEMRISGERGGISEVLFDWIEEASCADCRPEAYEQDGRLTWGCDVCDGGSAELVIVEEVGK